MTATLVVPVAVNATRDVSYAEGAGTAMTHEAEHAGPGAQISPSCEKRLRVLLVDDHVMMRQALRSILDGYPDVELVGEAGDGLEALALVDQLHPSVVVMDINMPHMSGIKATLQIKAHHPEIFVIGLTVNAGAEIQEAMRKAGAVQCITKEAAVDDLYQAIQTAVSGAPAQGSKPGAPHPRLRPRRLTVTNPGG